VLVTGVTGFVGSRLAVSLKRRNVDVTGMSRSSPASLYPVVSVPSLNDVKAIDLAFLVSSNKCSTARF